MLTYLGSLRLRDWRLLLRAVRGCCCCCYLLCRFPFFHRLVAIVVGGILLYLDFCIRCFFFFPIHTKSVKKSPRGKKMIGFDPTISQLPESPRPSPLWRVCCGISAHSALASIFQSRKFRCAGLTPCTPPALDSRSLREQSRPRLLDH